MYVKQAGAESVRHNHSFGKPGTSYDPAGQAWQPALRDSAVQCPVTPYSYCLLLAIPNKTSPHSLLRIVFLSLSSAHKTSAVLWETLRALYILRHHPEMAQAACV